MKKSILVNYIGGYCGNFLSSMIAEALGTDYLFSKNEETNTYYYNSDDINIKYIKPFGKLFNIRENIIKKQDMKYIIDNKLDPFYEHIFHLYNILDDPDDERFFINVKEHFKELMETQKNEFFVSPIHYGFYYKNFSLHEVFPDSTILHVISENKKYGRYFKLLFYFKTKEANVDKVFQSYTLSEQQLYRNIISPETPYIRDQRSIPVDMGKLIFENDFEHLSEVESKLSKSIDRKIVFDRAKFSEYAHKNIEIIKSIFGNDYANQTEKEQIRACLDYIEKDLRNNG